MEHVDRKVEGSARLVGVGITIGNDYIKCIVVTFD
jgi:hypothetical protein